MRSVQLSLFQDDKDFPAFLHLQLSSIPPHSDGLDAASLGAIPQVKLPTEARTSRAQSKLSPEAPPFIPASANTRTKRMNTESAQTPEEPETAPDLSDAISADGDDDDALTPESIFKMIIETLLDLANDPACKRL